MIICLLLFIFEKQKESRLGGQSAAHISIMKSGKQISKCFKDFERGLPRAKLLVLTVYCHPIYIIFGLFPIYSLYLETL